MVELQESVVNFSVGIIFPFTLGCKASKLSSFAFAYASLMAIPGNSLYKMRIPLTLKCYANSLVKDGPQIAESVHPDYCLLI